MRLLTKLPPLLFIRIINCIVSGMVFSTTEVCLLNCAVRAEADSNQSIQLMGSDLKLCPLFHLAHIHRVAKV